MGKELSKKVKRKRLPVKVTYRQVEVGGIAILALDRAFDILFDEVLKRGGSKEYVNKSILTVKNN